MMKVKITKLTNEKKIIDFYKNYLKGVYSLINRDFFSTVILNKKTGDKYSNKKYDNLTIHDSHNFFISDKFYNRNN